jgi:hypothetical protein
MKNVYNVNTLYNVILKYIYIYNIIHLYNKNISISFCLERCTCHAPFHRNKNKIQTQTLPSFYKILFKLLTLKTYPHHLKTMQIISHENYC